MGAVPASAGEGLYADAILVYSLYCHCFSLYSIGSGAAAKGLLRSADSGSDLFACYTETVRYDSVQRFSLFHFLLFYWHLVCNGTGNAFTDVQKIFLVFSCWSIDLFLCYFC